MHRFGKLPGRGAVQQLVENYTQTPDVSFLDIWLLAGNLRRHVEGGSTVACKWIGRGAVDSESEVANLDDLVLDEYILWFEISMN